MRSRRTRSCTLKGWEWSTAAAPAAMMEEQAPRLNRARAAEKRLAVIIFLPQDASLLKTAARFRRRRGIGFFAAYWVVHVITPRDNDKVEIQMPAPLVLSFDLDDT